MSPELDPKRSISHGECECGCRGPEFELCRCPSHADHDQALVERRPEQMEWNQSASLPVAEEER